MKTLLEQMTKWLKENKIVVSYGILSFMLELFSLVFFDCYPYIRRPVYPLLLWGLLLFTLYILNSNKLKAIYSTFFIVFQGLLIVGCDYLYLSNGTTFEKSMVEQRNDAYATIEQFNVNPVLLAVCLIVMIGYWVFLFRYLKKSKKQTITKRHRKVSSIIIISVVYLVFIGSLVIIPTVENSVKSGDFYKAKLYKAFNSYQDLGPTANCLYELIRMNNINNVDASDVSDVDSFIYSKRCDTSAYHGISKGNNLIMILGESFEWYPLQMYSKEITDKLYPNLSKLVNESAYCDNFYSREKTDTAEALMMIGSNPRGKYVHNDFANNEYPYSMPNMFRRQAISEGDDNVKIRSFHQNKGNFYNREIAHKSFGFDELVDIDDMAKYGVANTWNSQVRERNLDSLAINAMKDEMFPTDRRFYTFWISFSTHGFYHKRKNLQEYYDKFDQLGVFPEGDENQNNLHTYAAAYADLDKAIGIMFDDLKKKNLLDKTTICLIADHNTYYNGLSNYAKKINTQFDSKLYRVPMIIYDQKLTAAMDSKGDSRAITKFTTTTDVIPTLLDLFGIPGWQNLYLGSTIFNKDKESIIYSRAYNIFITDKYICYSLGNIKYQSETATKETKKDFENRALKQFSKQKILDKIFYSNYFENHEYKP